MSKLQVLIVDDHALLRTGLRLLIDTHSGMEVVGEANSVTQARAVRGLALFADRRSPRVRGDLRSSTAAGSGDPRRARRTD